MLLGLRSAVLGSAVLLRGLLPAELRSAVLLPAVLGSRRLRLLHVRAGEPGAGVGQDRQHGRGGPGEHEQGVRRDRQGAAEIQGDVEDDLVQVRQCHRRRDRDRGDDGGGVADLEDLGDEERNEDHRQDVEVGCAGGGVAVGEPHQQPDHDEQDRECADARQREHQALREARDRREELLESSVRGGAVLRGGAVERGPVGLRLRGLRCLRCLSGMGALGGPEGRGGGPDGTRGLGRLALGRRGLGRGGPGIVCAAVGDGRRDHGRGLGVVRPGVRGSVAVHRLLLRVLRLLGLLRLLVGEGTGGGEGPQFRDAHARGGPVGQAGVVLGPEAVVAEHGQRGGVLLDPGIVAGDPVALQALEGGDDRGPQVAGRRALVEAQALIEVVMLGHACPFEG